MNFTDLADLASARLGGKTLAANDEFFAPKENLLKEGRGIFIEGKFTSRGKWMDGWETRRKRGPGHDWCLIQLGMRGVIRGIDVDTNHFVGNCPQHASLEARDGNGPWAEIFPKTELKGGSQNLFTIASSQPWTQVKLNIYPDGGVARLRIYGDVLPDWKKLARSKKAVDLAAIENGGLVLLGSDMFFGHKNNLIMPGRSKNMGDGWETKRRRGPGHDWVILRLGAPGRIEKIEVDTNHFKGNYPDSFSLEGCGSPQAEPVWSELAWEEILPQTKLQAHKRHFFTNSRAPHRAFTHVRFSIFPDGGVSRLRLYGRIEKP